MDEQSGRPGQTPSTFRNLGCQLLGHYHCPPGHDPSCSSLLLYCPLGQSVDFYNYESFKVTNHFLSNLGNPPFNSKYYQNPLQTKHFFLHSNQPYSRMSMKYKALYTGHKPNTQFQSSSCWQLKWGYPGIAKGEILDRGLQEIQETARRADSLWRME